MNEVSDGYTLYYATATGLQTITSASSHIKRVVFCGTGTGAIQFFAGVTASASATPVIRVVATNTSNVATQIDLEYYASGGFTVNVVGSLDPRIMLFWRPVPAGA